jgi:hypothetical protein
MEELCRAYWYPLYYARRRGYAVEEAQDLTQERHWARSLAQLAQRFNGAALW